MHKPYLGHHSRQRLLTEHHILYYQDNPWAGRDRHFYYHFAEKTITWSLKDEATSQSTQLIFQRLDYKASLSVLMLNVNKILILWYSISLKTDDLLKWFIKNFNQKPDNMNTPF